MQLCNCNCKHFNNSYTLGHCPFVGVCHEDCVLVWKNNYNQDYYVDDLLEKIDNLQEELDDVKNELSSNDDELYTANDRADEAEELYDKVIDDLAFLLTEEQEEYIFENSSRDWVIELRNEWDKKHTRGEK